jgi:hypothetical protein
MCSVLQAILISFAYLIEEEAPSLLGRQGTVALSSRKLFAGSGFVLQEPCLLIMLSFNVIYLSLSHLP